MAAKQKQEKQTSWLVLIAIGMGILMAMLDITIVNVALPTIQHEFHTSYVSTQWIVNAYTATYAISILLISKLGDMYGKKLFFLLSMGIFTAGSLLCAITPNSLFLNISRGIEGVGGAGILGLSMALIGDNYEGKNGHLSLESGEVSLDLGHQSDHLSVACSFNTSTGVRFS